MGMRYAYQVLIPRSSVDTLIESVVRNVVDDDAHHRLANSRFNLDDEDLGEVGLTFLFPADDSIPPFERIDHLSDPATGRVAVGCLLCSIEFGGRYALFEARAATSGMSVAFRGSPNIRAVFLQIAQQSDALLVAFYDERCDRALIWPREARTREFDIDEFCYNEIGPLDVDRYGSWLLSEYERLNGEDGPVPGDE